MTRRRRGEVTPDGVRVLSRNALALLVVVLALACRTPTRVAADAGAAAPENDAPLRARSLALPGSPLGDRPSVLATAESVEALAVKEAVGARAMELHALAASVLERAYRAFGHEQDGKEAVLLYQHAASDLRLDGACAAATRGALLAGEVAHDPEAAYIELYRASRRASATGGGGDAGASPPDASAADGCPALARAMRLLESFRPVARVLDAVDQGLEGEGLVPVTRHPDPTPVGAGGEAPRLTTVEPIAGLDAARVVLTLSKTARFRASDVAVPGMGPPHTYVDLDGVTMGSISQQYPMTGIVTRVRADPTPTGARVTLDLDGPAYRKVFYLPEPYRVIIDIARHPPGLKGGSRRRVERVVLDPGHGGWDPGAIGPGRVAEKDVTLAIARRVAPVLAREGLTVLATRDDDVYVSLEERTARANAFGADLFVSIHCNAAENHARHGVETYVLDTTKDEIASRVAARENATSQAATSELGSILASLRMADQANHSTHLADLLQRAAMVSLRDAYPGIHDGGVHTAGFYVLVGARMPSVLFETSYISNPNEEARLGSPEYQQRLADAIVNAIRAYREGK